MTDMNRKPVCHKILVRQVLTLAKDSNIDEFDNVLKVHNLKWIECKYPTGDTPLHVAAKDGNVKMLRYLLCDDILAHKVVNITNAAGKTALHEAAQNAQPEAVTYLLSKGANSRALKQADWTPLMLACTKTGENALQCCRAILEVGGPASLADRNKDGWNALHIAAREGDNALFSMLILADPWQSVICSKNGRTPLHTAALHGHHNIVKTMLSCGLVDCNAQDSCGSTPLHDAARSGSIDTLQALIDAGAEIYICNKMGYGILHMVAEVGGNEVLSYLCQELKMPVDIQDKRVAPPLHCAVRAGQMHSVLLLLKYGANPNLCDSSRRSCFDIVPGKNANEIKRILREAVMSS